MNRAFHGPNELKIGSSILARRGGTDAHAPESPRKAFLRDRHVGILAPRVLENPGKMTPKSFQKLCNLIFTGPGLAEMSNGCIVLDKNMCPDPMEALKPSGDS